MRAKRLEAEIDQRLEDAREVFAIGQVSAVAGSRLTVITTGGAALTVPRTTSWTPAAGDLVVLAVTPAGWIALGKILP